MPTNTAGSVARDVVTQQTHYLRKRLLGTSGNVTHSLGFVPAGANIVRITTTAQNTGGLTGGSATVSFGTAASVALWFAANGTPVTSNGTIPVTMITTANAAIAADTELVAVVAGTPTGGAVDVLVEFSINNDK